MSTSPVVISQKKFDIETHKSIVQNVKTDSEAFSTFIQENNDGSIVRVLEKLGRLNGSQSKAPLLNLAHNSNDKIRTLATKNLAKLADISLLPEFMRLAESDSSTEVRREAVSAIGRLRNRNTIKALEKFLVDPDPKIVFQSIRGLIVFSQDSTVQNILKPLLSHPNEEIRSLVEKELKNKKQSNSTNNAKSTHTAFPPYLQNTVIHGDVLEALKQVPDESIHLTFTSPPYYNARDYSIYPSYEYYLKFLEQVFSEVHRITKEGRFFVLNTSPIIIPRISRAHSSTRYPIPYDIHPLLIKMGWEFIDDIIWVKPEASVKNRNAGFLQHRKPLAYKPNAITELLMVYRKKSDKLIDWNIHQYDSEAVNESKVKDGYETTNVWHIDPCFDKVHSAVFPCELCERVIRYYSFKGDLIFDPFAGSGTVGRAAASMNRYFFLCEKEKKYVERIAEMFEKKSGKNQKKLLFEEKVHMNITNLENFNKLKGKCNDN